MVIAHRDFDIVVIAAVGDIGKASRNAADIPHAKSRRAGIDGDVDLAARQMQAADGCIVRAAKQTDDQRLRCKGVFPGDGHAGDGMILSVVAAGEKHRIVTIVMELIASADGRPVHARQINIRRLDVMGLRVIPDGIQLLGVGHPIRIVRRTAAAVKDQRSRLFPQENHLGILVEGIFAKGDGLLIGINGDGLQIGTAIKRIAFDCGYAAADGQRFQRCTAGKGAISNRRDAVGNVQRLKGAAAAESAQLQRGNTLAQIHLLQTGAAAEGQLVHIGQRVGQHGRNQVGKVPEGGIGAGHALLDHHPQDPILIGTVGVIGHSTGAGNGQRAVRSQRPDGLVCIVQAALAGEGNGALCLTAAALLGKHIGGALPVVIKHGHLGPCR